MVRPASFGFNAETAANNAFQGSLDLSAEAIQQQAVAEFDAFAEKLRNEGVDIYVVQDTASPSKPDAVFPNNWFCSMPDGSLHLFPMYAPVRRLERRPEIVDALCRDFKVAKVVDWTEEENRQSIVEGTGSIIFDHTARLAYACLSERTDAKLMETFCQAVGYEPVLFTSKDENGVLVYHTNVMLHIGTDYAVVCLESIHSAEERENVVAQLQRNGKKVVDISMAQVHKYAGNMLQVHNKKGECLTVMSRLAADCLTDEQKAVIETSSRIVPADIPVIETIGGGSARCMLAEIFLERN